MKSMREKRLTDEQFRKAITGLNIGHGTVAMARAVLVEGRSQTEVAAEHGLTKGAVSQAVSKVWLARRLPEGFEEVRAVLPSRQAFIVRKWAKAAKQEDQK